MATCLWCVEVHDFQSLIPYRIQDLDLLVCFPVSHCALYCPSAAALLSPDERTLAVLDSTRQNLCLLPTESFAASPASPLLAKRFSACTAPTGSKRKGATLPSGAELFTAFCWSEDSSKLVLAGASGSIYTLAWYRIPFCLI